MGYFQVRYDSRVINYDRRGFIRLATGQRRERREQLFVRFRSKTRANKIKDNIIEQSQQRLQSPLPAAAVVVTQ